MVKRHWAEADIVTLVKEFDPPLKQLRVTWDDPAVQSTWCEPVALLFIEDLPKRATTAFPSVAFPNNMPNRLLLLSAIRAERRLTFSQVASGHPLLGSMTPSNKERKGAPFNPTEHRPFCLLLFPQ